MDVVKNIFKIRREKGISQEFIANALQVDTAVISNIENGKRELKVSELEIIAKALKVDVLYLLTYPHVYVKKEKGHSDPIETMLQLKLTGDKREKVLKLIFGDNNLEFLEG
ncbi:MAG: helix-turn-helix domain-containing protein [Dysgonamonadaceae bacterium]|jgi:transcriptional regulator with XRE-family HTH domain|nr:helix-turn-helix domain-containing protein [Dysgonamonadaceae bacterium]